MSEHFKGIREKEFLMLCLCVCACVCVLGGYIQLHIYLCGNIFMTATNDIKDNDVCSIASGGIWNIYDTFPMPFIKGLLYK